MDSVGLLRDYVEHGNEAAFGELVARYIDLVYSTAVRRVGGDADLARDVTQSVFTDLARKARSLGGQVMLGGWLHRHTGFVSASVVRSERRRQAREHQAAEMNMLHYFPDPAWQQLAPVLDESIDALDAPDREAIVLRFYERRDLRSVGAALGVSDDAAQKRVGRALDKLRALLVNRGVALSGAALAGLMAAQAVSAAPTGLAHAVRQGALMGAASGSGAALALVKLGGSLAAKWALGVTAAAALATALLMTRHPSPTVAMAGNAGAPAKPAKAPSSAGAPTAGSAGIAAATATSASNSLVLHLIAADSGKPIVGATIEFRAVPPRGSGPAPLTPLKLTSTEQGLCEIPLPAEPAGLVMVSSRVDGFVDTSLVWDPKRGDTVPAQYTLRLPRSVPIGGLVLNQDDKPVSGAEVRIGCAGSTSLGVPHVTTQAGETTVTDAQGRWRIDRFAEEALSPKDGNPAHFSLLALHSDYFQDATHSFGTGAWDQVRTQLLAGEYVFRLARRVALRGIVVDTDGQPVPNVRIAVDNPQAPSSPESRSETSVATVRIATASRGQDARATSLATGPKMITQGDGNFAMSFLPSNTRTLVAEMITQADGTFAIAPCRAGANWLRFEAAGFALAKLEVDLEPDMAPLRVRLQPAKPLRLRIMAQNGFSVPQATVTQRTYFEIGAAAAASGRSQRAGMSRVLFSQQADADGRVRWDGPPEGLLFVEVAAAGLRSTNVSVTADGEEHVITLAPALSVFGTVRDAATGEPVPHFTLSAAGSRPGPSESIEFEGGEFRHVEENDRGPTVRFRFAAEGYAPVLSREVQADAGEVQLDIKMQAAASTKVTVLLPEGVPATNADIALVEPGGNLMVVQGGLRPLGNRNFADRLSLGDHGRFTLPPCADGTWVVAAAQEGYAAATASALAAEPTLRLLPWGRIEGTCVAGGKPAAGASFRLVSKTPIAQTLYDVEADENGHFVFPTVPPGNLTLSKWSARGGHFTSLNLLADVAIQPGETKTMSVGAYTLSARLRWPEGIKRQADWSILAYYLQAQNAGSSGPGHRLTETAEGALVAEDMTAGSYVVKVYVGGPPGSNGQGKFLLRAEAPFTVPAEPSSGTLDLGEIVLQQ